ncbi:ROK family protein [Oceanobacillus longus]|uniref:ROK family protein n=1 Tax=Oceanobacillus longus TaxID=930120 RepID=A0ABV8H2C4_9BACI
MYTIGIDIGGTKIKFGMFDEQNKIVKVEVIKTPKEAVLETMIETISAMGNEGEIQGIGIATAGIIDIEKGVITSAANIPAFVNLPLKTSLEMEFHVPVMIANDANSAALAEGNEGVAKKVSNFISLTIGTGIGGGIIQDNKLVHGTSGFGGEAGHMVIVHNGRTCGCGRKGCWETYASGRALERMIQENPALASKKMQPKDLFLNYNSNDACKEIIDTFVDYLSVGILNLQYTMDPEMIVVGGGVIDSSDHWWHLLQEKITATSTIPINIRQAQLKNDASMIGAGYLTKK